MTADTIKTEDKYVAPFFTKIPISIERGEGVFVWDEEGRRFLDFTSGWGVTSLGHANKIITTAILTQAKKILQGPNAGCTYSPVRAKLLNRLRDILPEGLSRIFFTNSGAEANDAAIKLARKASGKTKVISMVKSFHGRTIGTLSATGQEIHRNRFQPLMPGYTFVPFNDLEKLTKEIKEDCAAVIVEPIQGEGGVNLPEGDYLKKIKKLCTENGSYLIADEIQTGLFRTGKPFAVNHFGVTPDFLTMAKGIAGGYPLGGFAFTEEIAAKLEAGDHGGTYCGNPLGSAVAYAVVDEMIRTNIGANVEKMGAMAMNFLGEIKKSLPGLIKEIRGMGLLIACEFNDPAIAGALEKKALKKGLFLNIKHGTVLRIFPALNIKSEEMLSGLNIIKECLVEEEG